MNDKCSHCKHKKKIIFKTFGEPDTVFYACECWECDFEEEEDAPTVIEEE